MRKPTNLETDTLVTVNFLNDVAQAEVSESDFEALHEVPSKRKDKKRIVVCHFKSRMKRDIVLGKCKTALRSHNKDLEPSAKLYVNEHLSPENKRLFAMATKIKYESNFKYLWSKNETIFLKKDDTPNSLFYKITCEDDLSQVQLS